MEICTTTTSDVREKEMKTLYLEVFPMVARYLQRHGADADMARELFQEALLIYYEQIYLGGEQPRSSKKAYLFGIARNLWRKSLVTPHAQQNLKEALVIAEEDELKPSQSRLLAYLQFAGQKCLDLLTAFYYDQCTMRDLAVRFGYRSERSATVQKYKCLEKVRDAVKLNGQQYEDFFE